MQAQALICDAQQRFSLETVTVPEPGAKQIAIKTAYSGVSIGTEFALIRNKISWGPYPLCTGYMATGVVEQVGAEVGNFKVGDKVYFRANDALALASGQKVTPVSGTHCSRVVLNPNTTHGAALLPAGAPMDLAAHFAVPAVGLFGVDMANPRMGQHVVVYGVGLVGQGVVAACAARGCVVTAVDLSDKALAIAGKMGADYLVNPKKMDLAGHVKAISPAGADVVFESTGLPAAIDPAIELCAMFGSFVWQGNYGSEPISMHFLPPHGRRLKMFFPCDDGGPPCRRAVVKGMAAGTLPWQHTITHRIGYAESPEMFERINKKAFDGMGIVIQWNV